MGIKVPVGYDTDGAGLEKQLSDDTSKAGRSAGKKSGESFGKSFGASAKHLIAGAGLLVGLSEVKAFLGDSIDEAREAQKVGAQTDLLVKKLGKSAGVTSKGMGDLATQVSLNVGIDDELIQSGENVLLGFKNIRNELGKGNDVFDRATKAAVDLSTTPLFKGNLTAASKALGKALADPAKGLTALGRVGIKFSDSQQKVIKNAVKTGDTLAAQKVILGEVEKRYKGTAAAQATASEKAGVAVKNLEEQIGGALLPEIDKLANKVTKDIVPAVSEFISGMEDGTGAGGQFAAIVKNDILPVAKNLGSEAKLLVGSLSPLLGLLKELPPGVVAFGGASAVLGSRLGSLRAPLKDDATGFDKLGRAGASLAGGAGLLLVADSAQRAGEGLGILESVGGGALAGLAAGGPVGAAIGAVGGLATAFLNSGNEAKKAVPQFHDYSDSLNQVTGASTKATKALIFQDLEKNDLLKTTRDLNISDQEVVRGIVGGKAARSRLIADLDAQKAAQIASVNAQVAAIQQEREAAIAAGGNGAAQLKKIQALYDSESATIATIAAIKKQTVSVDEDTLSLLQQNLATAETTKETRKATNALEAYASTHPSVRLELTGQSAVLFTLDQIRKEAANIPRSIPITVTVNTNANLAELAALSGGSGTPKKRRKRAIGGPVNSGEPYLVGERRPEIFVPNTAGRIVPKTSGAVSGQSVVYNNTTVIQNDYGPTTSRAKVRDLEWTLRFGTNARTGAERSLANA